MLGTVRSCNKSMAVGVITNRFKEAEDKERRDPLKEGLRLAEVDLEFAVEFLVLELDLERCLEPWAGVMSIFWLFGKIWKTLDFTCD